MTLNRPESYRLTTPCHSPVITVRSNFPPFPRLSVSSMLSFSFRACHMSARALIGGREGKGLHICCSTMTGVDVVPGCHCSAITHCHPHTIKHLCEIPAKKNLQPMIRRKENHERTLFPLSTYCLVSCSWPRVSRAKKTP